LATPVTGTGSGSGFAFRLGATPVRVHPSFFLMSAVLGLSAGSDIPELAVWLVVVTGSVLAHEMGHALAGRACGLAPAIDLHGMGGTTSWVRSSLLTWWQNVGISLAGPGVGFVIGFLVYALAYRSPLAAYSPLMGTLIWDLVWVNVSWRFFNMLPIIPLDGGNAVAAVLRGLTKGGGQRAAHVISIITASAILLLALRFRMILAALLAGLFAWQNIQALRR